MRFRGIRARGTILRTVYDKNKGLYEHSRGFEDTYSQIELEQISAKAVEFATKKIASELSDEYGLLSNPWIDFNITTLTADEKVLLSYLHFDPLKPIPTNEYSSIVGNAIKQSKFVTETLLRDLSGTCGIDNSGVIYDGSCNLGIPETTLDKIHDELVVPHLEVSELLGGSGSLIDSIMGEIDAAIANGLGCSKALRSFKDLLLVLKRGSITYIDYIAQARQNESMINMLKEFAYKVSCLNNIIDRLINGPDAQSGNVTIKANKPKPAIYAMAIFDLVDTWYRFLFPGQRVEPEKYNSLKEYVEGLGTETEGRAELYRLLDIVYTDPEELLADNQVAPGVNPYDHYTNSNNTNCSTETTSCCNNSGETTTETSDSSNNLTYITSGPLKGSVNFEGSLNVTSNSINKILIDDLGNITETTNEQVTETNNTCNICCCCPCICYCDKETSEPDFFILDRILEPTEILDKEENICCFCCCCPCKCNINESESESFMILDPSSNIINENNCNICCCCPCKCQSNNQINTDICGNETSLSDISGIKMKYKLETN
jgi:hypothetical protein